VGERHSEKQAKIRQILVVTDGCSNIGDDPIEAAMIARRKGIVVNVIGVVDQGDMGKQGRDEAMSIADAGGGMCRIVHPADLAATAQMLTHQTMQLTLQQVVNKELLQVMGQQTEDLPPEKRAAVMQVVDKLEEELRLELIVAVDTSASMREKIPTVREAIRDLSLSLQARLGESQVAVLTFPGTGDTLTERVQDFDVKVDMRRLESLFIARGGTPTAPAIVEAIRMFDELDTNSDLPRWTDKSARSS
jgi:Ca-activated chloride channel homolog